MTDRNMTDKIALIKKALELTNITGDLTPEELSKWLKISMDDAKSVDDALEDMSNNFMVGSMNDFLTRRFDLYNWK